MSPKGKYAMNKTAGKNFFNQLGNNNININNNNISNINNNNQSKR